MNDKALEIIKDVIDSQSNSLDLSGLGLTYLQLPIEDLLHIKDIKISNNLLTSLPDEFDQLSQIKFLNISNNPLKVFPKCIFRLEKIIYLNMDKCNLNEIPEDIKNIKKLTYLHLAGNKLKTLPESIGENQYIANLYLYKNEISSLPESFKQLKEIEYLNLNSNNLVNFPEQIVNCQLLERLDLGNNMLKSISYNIGYLNHLTLLDLSNNNIINIPDSISNLTLLEYLFLSNNQISNLSESIGELRNLKELDLSNNRLSSIPDKIDQLYSLTNLYLKNNLLEVVPENMGNLQIIELIDLSNNKLDRLPKSIFKAFYLKNIYLDNNQFSNFDYDFSEAFNLHLISIRYNKLDQKALELDKQENSAITIDYRNNPFLIDALSKNKSFTKIWQDVPYHLRDLLEVYFSSFKVFFTQKTNQTIDFHPRNERDGFVFEFRPSDENDPLVVDTLLKEYFDILKKKISEGAEKGSIYPSSTNEPANFYAQTQAINFSFGIVHVKNTIKNYVAEQDVYQSVINTLDKLDSQFQEVVKANNKLWLDYYYQRVEKARLEGASSEKDRELVHRRLESQTRASTPTQILVSQQLTLTNQVNTDFGILRELLHDRSTPFQREEASKLQEKIETVAAKSTAATPEEKKVLGSGLKRWLESVKETLTTTKEIGDVVGDLSKHWDKLKEFSQTVLNDPQLGDMIDSVRQAIEGVL